MTMPIPPNMQQHVTGEINRALGEIHMYPTIAKSILIALRNVVGAWPNIYFYGQPMVIPEGCICSPIGCPVHTVVPAESDLT